MGLAYGGWQEVNYNCIARRAFQVYQVYQMCQKICVLKILPRNICTSLDYHPLLCFTKYNSSLDEVSGLLLDFFHPSPRRAFHCTSYNHPFLLAKMHELFGALAPIML